MSAVIKVAGLAFLAAGLVGIGYLLGIRSVENSIAPKGEVVSNDASSVRDRPNPGGGAATSSGNHAESALIVWDALARDNPKKAFTEFCARQDYNSKEAKKLLDVILSATPLDPNEIWETCLTSKNEGAANLVAYKMAGIWAQKDPDRFLSLVAVLPQQTRDMISGPFAAGLAGQPVSVIAKIAPSFERLCGEDALTTFGSNLVTSAREASPKWPQFLAECLPSLGSESAKTAAIRTGMDASADPVAFALEMQKNGIPQKAVYEALGSEVLRRSTGEPEFAGRWINGCPRGPVRDHAAAAYAKAVHLVDPDAAVAWAREIQDSELRDSTLAAVEAPRNSPN